MTCRIAYRQVADRARAVAVPLPVERIELPAYAGAPGKPDWAWLAAETKKYDRRNLKTSAELNKRWSALRIGVRHANSLNSF